MTKIIFPGDDPAYDALCEQNDLERKASSPDHRDEIPALEAALRTPWRFSAAGLRVMRQRLEFLRMFNPTK